MRRSRHSETRCLFSQEADPQPNISKDATEKLVTRTAAGSHSGMDGYELHGHLSEQLFSAIVDYFANFSSSVGSVSEEIYSLQAVYFSYTWRFDQMRLPEHSALSATGG